MRALARTLPMLQMNRKIAYLVFACFLLSACGTKIHSIHYAALQGDLPVVKKYLDRGKKPDLRISKGDEFRGYSLLHLAVRNGHEDIVKLLLVHGANVNLPNHLNGMTPLHTAAESGLINITKLLIKHGAAVNAKTRLGVTPLHLAAMAFRNRPEIVNILLDSNANITSGEGSKSGTPLHSAVYVGDVGVAEILLQKGAMADAKNRWGFTALHKAVVNNSTDIVKLLLRYKTNVNESTRKEGTAMHLAAKYGRADILQLLIKNGGNHKAPDRRGQTPFAVAKNQGHVYIADILEKEDPTVVLDYEPKVEEDW